MESSKSATPALETSLSDPVMPFQRLSRIAQLALVQSIREDRLINKLRQKQLRELASELGALSDAERREILAG